MNRTIKPGKLSLLLLLVFLVPLLAACGGAATSSPTSAAEVPTAAIVATPDSTGPAEPNEPTSAPTEPAEPTSAPTEPAEPTSVPTEPATASSVAPDYLEFGVVTHLYYTDRDRVLQLSQNAGFDWIRQQVVWRDIEDPVQGIYGWEELDAIVATTNAYGLKLLVNVVQAPTAYNPTNGLPADPKDLGNFLELMVQRYGNQIHAYEIWNEPNLAHETGGYITPEDVGLYVEILKEAYTRIKGLNPDAIVLAAASSSSGVTNPNIALSDEEFYRAMYTYNDGEVRNYFDVQAVHPGGSANPPDTLWPDNPSNAEGWTDHPTFYFRHIENVRSWMEEYGLADKEMWITEYGWATQNNTPGYEFGNQVSFEQQAEYITGAIRRTSELYPWVGNMFLWNMNFAVTKVENGLDPLHEQASFAILNPDWSPRPSYIALQRLIADLKQAQGR
jgi:hypothetical protein